MLLNKHKPFFIGLLLLIIPYFLWFIQGENSYVLIHDNLDQQFTNLVLLSDSCSQNSFDLSAQIPNVMNGIPRYTLGSCLNYSVLLFNIFSPFNAYILNSLLVHLIGYIGLYHLLKHRFMLKTSVSVVVSFLFSVLSYYHLILGIAISGQAILLFSFINFKERQQSLYDWFIIALFPFFSSMIFTLPYFLPVLLIMPAIRKSKKYKFNHRYYFALLLLIVISLLIEYQLLYGLLIDSFQSHRVEMNRYMIEGFPSITNSFRTLIKNLLWTRYHSGKFLTLPIILSFLLLKLAKNNISKIAVKILLLILSISTLVSLYYHLYSFLQNFTLIKIVNIDRFTFLMPLMWMIVLAYVLDALDLKKVFGKLLFAIIVSIQLFCIIIFNKEFVFNVKLLVNQPIFEPTYQQFFATDIFNDVHNYLENENHFNVISIGLFPSIAQFNNFKTLDSYNNNYSLHYKKQFREIIHPELEKDKELRNYYDYWGNRVYIFSSEIERKFLINKYSTLSISNLELNVEQLNQMNVKYIFSSVPIHNYQKLNFEFINSFSTEKSYWRVYLYRLK